MMELIELLSTTDLFLAPVFGFLDRIFRPRTPREVLQMRQFSGQFAQEGRRLAEELEQQYGTPIAMIAPVLSELDKRLGIRFPQLSAPPTSVPRRLADLPELPFASQRLAMLEQSGAMEQELQRQAQALQASGFRGSSLARAMMGARLGTMMSRERMLADLALQEYEMERQREERTYQRQLQNYQMDLHQHELQRQHQLQQLQLQLQQQQLREQAQRERFNLLMGLRSAFQEQAVKGGGLTMENILQSEQLATQQMMGLMQGIGALAGAYAQYRQNQEMLRTMQGLFQQQSAPAVASPAVPSPALIASAYRFFNPSRFIF